MVNVEMIQMISTASSDMKSHQTLSISCNGSDNFSCVLLDGDVVVEEGKQRKVGGGDMASLALIISCTTMYYLLLNPAGRRKGTSTE